MRRHILNMFLGGLAILGLTSCNSGPGTVIVRLVDGPTSDLHAINVEILRVELMGEEGEEDRIILGEPNRVVDLLALTGGVSLTLAEKQIASGHYGQLRLILGSHNSVVLADGSVHDLTTPSAQQSGIKLVVSFDVEPGTTKDIYIDFDAKRSVFLHAAGQDKYLLRPTVRAYDKLETGSITGFVRDGGTGVAGALVFAEQVTDPSSVIRTTTTAADGSYTLDLLPLGVTYVVVTQPVTYEAAASGGITLTAAAPVVSADLALVRAAWLGGISGVITPAAGAAESDLVDLSQILSVDGIARRLIVRTTTAVSDGVTETFGFEGVPVGSYGLRATRTTTAADGSVTQTPSSDLPSLTVPAGGAAAAALQF